MSRTTNLSSCFLKHGKHEKRYDSGVYAQPTSPHWHERRRRTTYEKNIEQIGGHCFGCTFFDQLNNMHSSMILFRFVGNNAKKSIEAICALLRREFNLEKITRKIVQSKKKRNEPVNQHSHQLDVKVVELIDSSGRITFCTEREMKERKAKKQFFFPRRLLQMWEKDESPYLLFIRLWWDLWFFIFRFSINFPTKKKQCKRQ